MTRIVRFGTDYSGEESVSDGPVSDSNGPLRIVLINQLTELFF